MSKPCCKRKNVSPVELEVIGAALAKRLHETAAHCQALGINPEATQICGDCRQKLMGKHRQFGGKAIVSRKSMAELTGRTIGTQRARWLRDEVGSAMAWAATLLATTGVMVMGSNYVVDNYSVMHAAVGADTTYADKRFAYIVSIVATESVFTLDTLGAAVDTFVRRRPTLDSIPATAVGRAVYGAGHDSVIFLSYDTLALVVLDSAVVDSFYTAWSITEPVAYLVGVPTRTFPPPPGGDFANEPLDYSIISQRVFTVYVEDGWGYDSTQTDYLVPDTSAGAPISPPDVGRARYPAGFLGGGTPLFTVRTITATDSLYIAFAVKYSSNWQGHNSGVNKILFVTAPDYGGGGDPVAIAGIGGDTSALNFQVRLQGPGNERSQAAGPNVGANLAPATLTRDVWYTIEVLLIANTGTSFNGKLDVWVDGVKTHEYTDIKYYDDAADASDHNWTRVKWEPTWGGVGDTVAVTQYQWMDHVRISGP